MVTAAHSPPRPNALRPRVPALRHLGPHRYGSVMGTATVGTAGAALPVHVPGPRTVCTAVRTLSLVQPAVPLTAPVPHWTHHDSLAVALSALLVTTWSATAVHTARGLVSGALLAGPRPAPVPPRPATARTTSGAVR